MLPYGLELINIAKHFDRRLLFKKINCTLERGQILTISGANGSGKSTLLRIMTGLLKPSYGAVHYYIHSRKLTPDQVSMNIGIVAPSINVYDELTAFENLRFLINVRGMEYDEQRVNDLLQRLGLIDFKNEMVSIFSTGMRQRLKIAAAILHDPLFLFLDEPFSNLDSEGMQIVDNIIEAQCERGCVVIASNMKTGEKKGDMRIELS